MLPGIGVYGTGPVCNVLVPLLRAQGFHIESIWGKNLNDAQAAAKELKIPFYTNKIDDVLLRKEVDLVFIICAPYLHAEISVKALGIGKHVVCDKPMGLSQADALKMVRASNYYPQLISLVNYSLRFLPAFTHLKKALSDEIIGPINSISLIDIRVQMGSLLHDKFDWMCDAAMGGGALNLIGSHVIDLINFLFGKRAIRVHGLIKTYTKQTSYVNGIRQISAPDFCTFQLELDGGILVTASLHSHNVASNTFIQEILICGRAGHLVVRGGDLYVLKNKTIDGNNSSVSGNIKEEAIYVDIQDLHFSTSDSLLPRPYIKGLCKMIGALKEAFSQREINWVKEPVRAAANFENGLYVQAVLEALRKSSETRQWCRVEINTESPTNQEQILKFARM